MRSKFMAYLGTFIVLAPFIWLVLFLFILFIDSLTETVNNIAGLIRYFRGK